MTNPVQLVELLRGHKTYIQTHNFPDPDAIGSAFGLQQFLKYHDVESTICYDGRIDKLSTKRMLSTFGIDILSNEELGAMTEDDYIVTVDAQKYNANLTDFIGNEVACIDHHPTFIECEYKYRDVRINGSCSSMIAQYFHDTNTPMNADTASALAYGMKMDTAEFTRGVKDLDVEMFCYVYKFADTRKLTSMYNNVLEYEDIKAYGAAIESIKVYGKVGFASIPFDCPDALIAMISDFILSLDVVNISIVHAIRKDGLKFSVRSDVQKIDAGILTRDALKEYGNGGGHQSMAGGFIPKANITKMGNDVEFAINETFLEQIEKYNVAEV